MLLHAGTALLVILAVSVSTRLLVGLRIEQIAEPEKLAVQGVDSVRRQDATDYTLMALALGALAAIAYSLLASRWPATVDTVFMAGASFMTLSLSAAAAVIRPRAGMAGVPEMLALYLIWGAGYGWLLPIVMGQFDLLSVI